eukprot:jgi/Astpho2/5312/Aster-x0672
MDELQRLIRAGLQDFDARLASTAVRPGTVKAQLVAFFEAEQVQKLALLLEVDMQQDRVMELVPPIAIAARRNLLQLKDMPALLWGFAELGVQCPETDDLILLFASSAMADSQPQHLESLQQRQGLAPAEVTGSNVVWAREEREDKACKDMVTMLWSYGRMVRRRQPAVQAHIDTLAAALTQHLGAPSEDGLEILTPDDLVDVVHSIVQLSTDPAHTATQPPAPAGSPSRPLSALMDGVAGSVRRQLANKHSMLASFLPTHVTAIPQAYAQLQHHTSHSSAMLDAIAGYVVRRVKTGHLHALSRPAGVVALLEAFSQMGHSTVVVPELLATLAGQMQQQLVLEHEQSAQQVESSSPDAFRQASEYPPHLIAALLDVFCRLGFHPGDMLLRLLLLQLQRSEPGDIPVATALQLLQSLAVLQHDEGDPAAAMLRAVIETSKSMPQQELQATMECLQTLREQQA